MCSLPFPLCSLWCMILMITTVGGANSNMEFRNCSSTIQCGSFHNIGYPFWGANRADYCGRSADYQVTCASDNTTLEITLSGRTYRVLEIDAISRVATVAVNDYYRNICPETLHNVTSVSPFSYSSDTVPNNLTIYYNCTSSTLPTTKNQFVCAMNGTVDAVNYFVISRVSDIAQMCSKSVVLPLKKMALQTLEANLTEGNLQAALADGFELQWPNDSCQFCIESGGECGRKINTTDEFACYCRDKVYPFTCGLSSGLPTSRLSLILSGLALPVALVICFGVIWFRRYGFSPLNTVSLCKGNGDENRFDVENFFRNHQGMSPRRYNYSDLKRMTGSFSEKLGQGGYGSVYKGKLKDGRLVAVKILIDGSKGNGDEFFNEVASISRTAHVNVVALLGFCYDRKKRALIYEYMSNGSLDNFIAKKTALGCKVRLQIALGVARGLEYLHRGCNTRIVHFDIKPHNILLDQDLVPKISDFGLAKLWQGKESIVSMLGARGTIGYIAPEVFLRNFGGVSHKSDVYSYGMLVLDMVCGRYNSDDARASNDTSDADFPNWIYKEYLQPGEDITLSGITTDEEEEITRKMIVVGLWCIQTHPSNRPSIKEVLEMLEGSSQALQVPPKPLLAYPNERLPLQLYSTTASSSFNGVDHEFVEEKEALSLVSQHK